MNKMDINMTTQTAPDENKPQGIFGIIRRIGKCACRRYYMRGGSADTTFVYICLNACSRGER